MLKLKAPISLQNNDHVIEYRVKMGYLAAFGAMILAFLFIFLVTSQLLGRIRRVMRTNSGVQSLEALTSAVKEASTYFSGFVATRDPKLIMAYDDLKPLVDSLFRELRTDFQYDYLQMTRLKQTGPLIEAQFSLANNGIAYFRRNNRKVNDTMRIIVAMEKQANARVLEKLVDLKLTGATLQAMRADRLTDSSAKIITMNVVSLLMVFGLLGASAYLYARQYQARRVAYERMRKFEAIAEQQQEQIASASTELEHLREIEKFASTGSVARAIAHEIRNPLSNINLATEQLKSSLREEDEYGRTMLGMIMRNNTRIHHLVIDLLNSARIPDLNFSSVSVNQLLDESLDIAKDQLQLNRIVFEKAYDSNVRNIRVDADKMKIAFLNIIVNAIESMEPGKGRLFIRTEELIDSCRITIADNGEGIDEESLNNLFKPYFTRKKTGIGLGLTTTYNIIATHKGTIQASSVVGQGTVFTLLLNKA